MHVYQPVQDDGGGDTTLSVLVQLLVSPAVLWSLLLIVSLRVSIRGYRVKALQVRGR